MTGTKGTEVIYLTTYGAEDERFRKKKEGKMGREKGLVQT